MGKRKSPVVLDIDDMINDPSQRGMLSFLDVGPDEKRRMLESRAAVERGEAIPFPAPTNAGGRHKQSDDNDSIPQDHVSTDSVPIHSVPPASVPGHSVPREEQANSNELSTGAGVAFETHPVQSSPVQSVAYDSVPLQFGARATTRRRPFPIRTVQDCHTPAEDKVFFQLLAFAKDPKRRLGRFESDGSALCWASQPEIARRVHMHENNVRTILRSLSSKLSIEFVAEADRAEGKGRTWRIRPFRAIIERRRAANLLWAIKTGGGQIRFVSSEQIESLLTEYQDIGSMGNDSIPKDFLLENESGPIESLRGTPNIED